ncbi:hypothetical protein DFP72DRAFT_4246 [Ephemerocybe angulata]|uniref:DNA polymerase n=1 Tax=Ephemerocybe angulata TaxID=980116 RepID=A0A8H6MH95_9AGAR|nr:hypothetical protein DFP72DRAFT_4246 [Tulosesus angulatus]
MSTGTTFSNTASQGAKFRVSLNQIDYTVSPPGPLDNSDLPAIPVIRIYGNSSTGQKTCLHVHQVYPYFYVDYAGSLKPQDVRRYIRSLVQSINHAVALSMKRNPDSPKSRYLRGIILVKGVHFYGFHSSYSPFLKVLIADPTYTNRVVTILRSGSVMGTRFRIYESHLSFPLQFMCDFGLYGCGLVDLEDAWQRGKDEDSEEPDNGLKESPYYRQTKLPLEVDVIAPQIRNRHQLASRKVDFKIGERPPQFPDEPLVPSVRELWEDERERRKARGLPPSPELPVEASDASRGPGADWVAEARYWEAIRNRIEGEAKALDPLVTEVQPWEGRVMTTFESIEALWEPPWKRWKPALPAQNATVNDASGEDTALREEDAAEELENGVPGIDVDISLISNEDLDELDDDVVDILGKGGIFDEDLHAEGEEPNTGAEREAEDNDVREETPVPLIEENEDNDPFAAPADKMLNDGVDSTYILESPPSPEADVEGSKGGERRSVTPTKSSTKTSGFKTPHSPFLDDGDKTPTKARPGTSSQRLPDTTKKKARVLFQDEIDELEHRVAKSLASDEQMLTSSESGPSQDLVEEERRASMIVERTVQLSQVFHSMSAKNSNQFEYSAPPPTRQELALSCDALGVPQKVYQAPYYSAVEDIPARSKEYGGLMFTLKGKNVASLEDWRPLEGVTALEEFKTLSFTTDGVAGWEYAGQPPSVRQTKQWLAQQKKPKWNTVNSRRLRSQIEGPTQANIYGLKNSPIAGDTLRESSNMSIFCLEVFALSENGKNPNPEKDRIVAAFYAIHVAGASSIQTGLITVDTPPLDPRRLREFPLEQVDTELDLIIRVTDLILELDPDILTGWEIQKGSWGYLSARGEDYGLDVSELMSRAPPRRSSSGNDNWGFRKTSTFQVIGRHVFNTWRVIRSEQTLTIYTFENVAFHLLQRRFPKYSPATLTEWYHSPIPAHTARLLQYISKRTYMVLEMLEQIEIVTKTAEFARIFGVDFFSVISRGSQFKVESFMFRIAKPESFVLISPSKADVGRQNAAECMPLIMEPQSAFYSSPLVVLDFQSLYPSIMIAYNYCYSTCLGRVQPFQGKYKFGVVPDLDLPDGLLGKFKDDIHVAPNGMMYVKSNIRKGLLGRMLIELLDTRVMVKQAMKSAKNDKALKRVLDARQLGLKYIANVTYGYTSASYSGRMPGVEIADSIVQSGRETLEKAIMLVNKTKKWGAQVVYGDTDSMFIYLRGKTKEEAFRIGYEMADAVTALNPAPIKLKFEKVYLPCVLMAKKRYVGFKYESIDAEEPGFDAKGIETVRRDGVLAQRKMTENCLKILFRTQDLSEVKDYCTRSWAKLLENKASAQDFIFAKEVRMGSYSDNGVPPPGVVVAARKMLQDSNYEPQYAERVPYVIARGGPGSRLVDRAMDPLDFLNNESLQLDANYYISKVLIPPLERIFNLMGADVKQWYQEMPKLAQVEHNSPRKPRGLSISPEKPNIDEHFNNAQCFICGRPASEGAGLCDDCWGTPQETISNLGTLQHKLESKLMATHLVCSSCTGSAPTEPIHCESLDCPWLYARRKAEARTDFVPLYEDITVELELDMDAHLSQVR